MIVGLLPYNGFVKFVDEEGVKRNVSQCLVVAQVCRQLRRVVLAADFWQDHDFCFSELLEEREVTSRAPFMEGIRVGGLVKALLDDANSDLVNCLKRRKSWHFDSEVVLAMLVSRNWFAHSAEAIKLDMSEWQLIPALRALCLCPQILELEIRVNVPSEGNADRGLHLGVISQCLPNLQKLAIEFDNTEGSLEGLGNLTYLSLTGWAFDYPQISQLLPLASRSTLKSLRIAMPFPVTTDILNNFSNLTHLTCEELDSDLMTALKNITNVRLHSLQGVLFGDQDVSQLGASQSLSELRQLHLEFQGLLVPYDERLSELVMQVVSQSILNFGFSRLQKLEHLRLYGGFDLTWCRTLASLKSLKCLELGIVKGAIGSTVAGQFYPMKEIPQLEGLRMDFVNLVELDGLTAILEKEFEWISQMKIFYVKSVEDFARDLSVDHFNCLCVGSV